MTPAGDAVENVEQLILVFFVGFVASSSSRVAPFAAASRLDERTTPRVRASGAGSL
jgi:hypothetical protein